MKLDYCRVCLTARPLQILIFPDIPLYLWPTGNSHRDRYEKLDLALYHCKKCNHYQIQNLERSLIEKLYRFEYLNLPSYLENQERAQIIRDQIKDFGLKVLDIGGGTNPTWTLFPEYDYTILDPHLPPGFDGRYIKGLLEENQLEAESYDVIFAFHILEHMESPRKAIRQLHSALRKNGLFAVEVPDYNYYANNLPHYLYFHQHINLFCPRTLELLFTYEGFCPVFLNNQNGRLLMFFKRCHENTPESVIPLNSNTRSLSKIDSDFFKRIEIRILEVLGQKSSTKGTIFLGAGGSSTLLMYHMPSLLRSIDFFMDSDPRKVGHYLPGTSKEIEELPPQLDGDYTYLVYEKGIVSNSNNAKELNLIEILEIVQDISQDML